MTSFYWFLVTTFWAGLSVGLTMDSIRWGMSTVVLLFALRNAVMAGYVEGRVRYEDAKARGVRDPLEVNT